MASADALMRDDDSDDRPLEDWEYPDEDDRPDGDDGETATRNCPHCGSDIYEDALQCPQCGEYVTRFRPALAGRPRWWVALGLFGILAVLVALLLLGFLF